MSFQVPRYTVTFHNPYTDTDATYAITAAKDRVDAVTQATVLNNKANPSGSPGADGGWWHVKKCHDVIEYGVRVWASKYKQPNAEFNVTLTPPMMIGEMPLDTIQVGETELQKFILDGLGLGDWTSLARDLADTMIIRLKLGRPVILNDRVLTMERNDD